MNDKEREDAARVQLQQAASPVADEPLELPKALSEAERAAMYSNGDTRALALIDAQAALLAEYAAQAVLDGQRIDIDASTIARLTERAQSAERKLAAVTELHVAWWCGRLSELEYHEAFGKDLA
jgi:hypothetical protein